MDRFTHNGYAMVKNDDGRYVLHADHAAELARLEDDYLKLNNIACELRQRAERAEAYVAGQDVRSDFRTAAEMRAALEHAQAELARAEKANALPALLAVVEAAEAMHNAGVDPRNAAAGKALGELALALRALEGGAG